MPNPKKRHSKTRRNNRRAHDALSKPAMSLCPQCGEPKAPHHICQNCGTYKGRDVIKAKDSD